MILAGEVRLGKREQIESVPFENRGGVRQQGEARSAAQHFWK
jgi:hypothetical protein